MKNTKTGKCKDNFEAGVVIILNSITSTPNYVHNNIGSVGVALLLEIIWATLFV